jgi:putative transcriptional regulator
MKGWHPNQDMLVEYSAGTSPKAQGVCVAVHLHYCKACQVAYDKLRILGAQLWEEGPPVKVSDKCRSQVMALLDETPSESNLPKPQTAAAGSLEAPHHEIPSPLKRFVPAGWDSLHWQIYLPVLSVAHLAKTEGYQLALHKIKAGGKVVDHTHTGDEVTVVLSGSFSDQYGHYKEGDFVYRNGSHGHAPMASQDGDCICLTALQAPVKLTSWWGKLLNPLLR